MSSPKYSVVIPIYNSHPYIRATLDSVLAQTEQDFEVIVVDDGSSNPEGAEIVRTYTNPRVRLVVQENKGLPGARNRGIQESKGEYVALLDGDDIWYPFHLQGASDFFRRYPQIGWYTAHLVNVEFGRPIPEKTYTRRFSVRQPYDGVSPGHSSAMVVRRELFVRSGGFPEDFSKGQEDRIAYAKLAKIMPVTGVLSGVSVVYTKHPGSITKTVNCQYDFDFWKGVLSVLLPIGLHPKRKNNSSVREVVEIMLRIGCLTQSYEKMITLLKSSRTSYSLCSYAANLMLVKYCRCFSVEASRHDSLFEMFAVEYPQRTWRGRFLMLFSGGAACRGLRLKLWLFFLLALFARVVAVIENKRLQIAEMPNTCYLLREMDKEVDI